MDPGFFTDPDPGFKSPDPGFKVRIRVLKVRIRPGISLCDLNNCFYKDLEKPDQRRQC